MGEGWGEGENQLYFNHSASPSPLSPPARGGGNMTFYESIKVKVKEVYQKKNSLSGSFFGEKTCQPR